MHGSVGVTLSRHRNQRLRWTRHCQLSSVFLNELDRPDLRSIDATFIANALKSLCRRHTPNVTALRLLTLTTTRNSACTSPSRVRTTRNLGT